MFGRPPTGSLANRPSSRANVVRNPIQMASAARPQTGARPKTGVQVNDRPTTQQGLGGMRMTTSMGRGRVIQDSTYFCTEIRQKMNLVNNEIANLNKEAEIITRENSNLSSFEKKADAISEELRDLQSQLGDLNTLVDKLHVDADLEDIERLTSQITEKNSRESKTLDEVFLTRQQRDKQIKEIENQIESEVKKSDDMINNLPIEKRNQYLKLKSENAGFVKDITIKQKELEKLNSTSENLSKEFKNDSVKQKSLKIYEKKFELAAKKKEIEMDLFSLDQNGPQEKNKLLAQVKEDNAETALMERKIVELEEQSKKLKEQLAQLDIELDSGHQTEKNSKFEELLKRDKDMQAFIDGFELKKNENIENTIIVEKNIVAALDRLKVLGKVDGKNLPSRDVYKELKGDLSFKEKEMKNSETTSESLIIERDRRLQDLEKVNQLETKLEAELKALKSRQTFLNNEIKKVGNIEEVKKEAASMKKKNLIDREVLKQQKTVLKTVVSSTSTKHEAKSNQLTENETYNQLSSLEQKLRHHEIISTKKAESDYKPVAQEALKLTDEVNNQLLKLMSLPPA
ncbi:Intraflagellar transport protein 74, partial [Clydaea vesicula]